MKRTSYSMYRCNSAVYGIPVMLTDRLHSDLLTTADTLPEVTGYVVYGATFLYVSGGKDMEGNFPLGVRFEDRHNEFWASTWTPVPNHDSPLECARRGHAESLGAQYRLFTVFDLEQNRVRLKNCKTMQSILFRGFAQDTEALETAILLAVFAAPQTLGALAQKLEVSESWVQLATFRLWRKGRIQVPLTTELIYSTWTVERKHHA